ncbi:translin associated factor X [Syncephalastrum racemosum]|uniref:Translin associated factor X n=1 Tax=Syncephalastrum racemosum TaxID=13706 RepID=A0A1X2HHT7_SYNRA|nr:translin associated factor X [Syncephalastrum racemosum]
MDITQFFTECRDTLDKHYDKRERIIKLSRDITAQSKKYVFALHRATKQRKPNYGEALDKQKEIIQLFKNLAPDVQGVNYYRYSRSFSGGFEEFIEAVAFYHYLTTGTLIKKQEIDALFQDEQGNQWIHVQDSDYILGLGDFTGELMRYAIQIVTSGEYDEALKICRFLREMKADFELLAGQLLPAVRKKLGALNGSLNKVEKACYTFQIRGSEYPKHMYEAIIRDHQARYDAERDVEADD